MNLLSLDPVAGEAEIAFGPSWREIPQQLDVVPGDPLKKGGIKAAIARVIDNVAAGGDRYRAIFDLLQRSPPRMVGHALGAPLVDPTADLIEGTMSAVRRLDKSCLPIQGPPGTGKTYVSSHVILRLLRAGKRVAVTSNSHKAIDNLMIAVAERARQSGERLRAVKMGGAEEPIDPLSRTGDRLQGSCPCFSRTGRRYRLAVLPTRAR